MERHHRVRGAEGRAVRPLRASSRRQFLGGTSAGVLAAMLAGCTGGGQTSDRGSGGGDGVLQWWDQFRPLTELFTSDLFDPYMDKHPDVTIKRRQMDGADLGQALQVGRRSNQLPDVHSIAGLGSSAAALVSGKWFQPIGDLVDVKNSPVGDQLFDGIHRFDGKIYSFPTFSGRTHDAVPWFNSALLEEADVDPAEDPLTWDQLRAVARRITRGTADDVSGMVLPTKESTYLDALVNQLAMAAGAPGPGGIDWSTGEYIYDSQEFVDAVEFLLALKTDGVVHPAAASMGPRDARARWAAGEAAIYPWGTWFLGGLLVEEPDAVERGVGVWHIPCPEKDRNVVYSAPPSGTFWVSSASEQADVAAEILLQMMTTKFQTALAMAMDQPPALVDLVSKADVHPAYERCISLFEEDVRIGPSPEVAEPGVWRVLAEMRDIHPDVGEIVQSVLTGDSSDVAGQLSRYNDDLSDERERAIDVVKKDEPDIGRDAWVFGNWDPGSDYGQQDYAGR